MATTPIRTVEVAGLQREVGVGAPEVTYQPPKWIQGDGREDNPIMYFDANGNGPNYHTCGEETGARRRITVWLDRQRLIGITTEERAVVERLLEELF